MHSITVSLPVRNLQVSRAFFAELGFAFSPERSGPDCACLIVDENVRVLLLAQDRYRDCVNGDIGYNGCVGEVLISLPAASERAVDEIVMRAIVSGGRPWPVAEPIAETASGSGARSATSDESVYSGSFRDPDGHLWQVTCPREPARHQVPEARIAA